MVKKTEAKNSKPQSLRVLMVEDSEDDVLLIIRELKKGGYNPVYELVETAATMKKALKEKQWDIIICDYKLPKFDAPSAITLLKEANIDIPVIIVSGSIGEETAVECMRLGAHDYIMKNSLSRLCPAINRELEESEIRNKQRQVEKDLRESEEKYRTILESIEDGYYELDINGNFTFFNNSTCRILGYPQEELMGMNNRQYADKENAKKIFQAFNKVYRTGEPAKGFEWQVTRKDGTKRFIETSASLQKDSSGKPIGFLGITRDVTERKQAEEALQKSEAIYRLVVENINDIIWTFDLSSMTYTFVSPSAQRILGYSDETIMKNLDLVFTPETKQQILNVFGKFIEGKAQQNSLVIDAEHRKKDGSLVWMEINASPLNDDLGNIVGFLGVTRNITERKRADEALRESERKYKSLIDNFQDIILTINLEGRITFASQSTKERLGYESAEMINMNILDFVQEEDRQRAMESLQKGMKGEKITGFQTQAITKSGERLFFECFFSRVYEDGTVVGAQAVIKDITERKQAEETLLKSEKKFRNYIDSAPDGVFIVDDTGRYLEANKSACQLMGYTKEEIEKMSIRDLLAEESLEDGLAHFKKLMETGAATSDLWHKHKHGSKLCLTVNAVKLSATRVLGFCKDITKRKQAEEELQQTLERLRKAFGTTVQVMVSAVEAKDPYTAGHQLRTANLARAIATEMGLPREKIEGIRMAGSIHDIGKLSVPAEILTKPTKLSENEFSMIKEHAQKGYEMLKDVESPWPLAQIVYQHHERMDGSGYPRKLKGDEILIEARIMAVADVVEAMASYRPYRPALGIKTALEEIEKNRGMFYDADAADACLRLFREKGFQLERT